MTTTEAPRFARKEIRQAADELVAAGFQYDGDDTKGHARYTYAKPCTKHEATHCENRLCAITLPTTPRTFSLAKMRAKIGRVTGSQQRGSFDRTKQRERQAAEQNKAAEAERIRRLKRAEEDRINRHNHEASKVAGVARAYARGAVSRATMRAYVKPLTAAMQRIVCETIADERRDRYWFTVKRNNLSAEDVLLRRGEL